MNDWTNTTEWDISAGPEHVYREGQTTRFGLSARTVGNLTYYAVTYAGQEMDDAWSACKLFERGTNFVPWGSNKLPPWSPEFEYRYDKRIDEYLTMTTTDTRRLEGEIDVRGIRESVVIFLAKEAVAWPDGKYKDLFIIITRTRFPWSSRGPTGPSQDGTAHARPH